MDLCSIASGSSGNCIYVGTDHAAVLIDAGISAKRVVECLHFIDREPEDLDAILVTHEHSDHIQGLGVLARKFGLPIYSSPGTIREILSKNLIGSVDSSLFHEVLPDHSFSIKDLDILPFCVSHDAEEPVAFRLSHAERSLAVVTDLGYYDDYTTAHLQGLDVILVESNHDINMLQVGSYPYYLKQRILGLKGHLSNDNAGRLLCEILHENIRTILLGHLSKENNYEALALATVREEITMGDNPFKADDFPIGIAKRDVPTPMITF